MTVQKRTLRKKLNDLGLALVLVGAGCIWPVSSAFAADPFAANNGLYPTTAQWSRSYRISNYDYP